MDDPADETAAEADVDTATLAEPADVVETAPIAEEEEVPVLVVVTEPVTLVEAEVAEAAPAVITAETPMPTAPTPSDILNSFQSSHLLQLPQIIA